MAAYATLADLGSLALPPIALSNVPDADKTAAIEAASSEADGYLASQYVLPIVTWGVDLTQHVCAIAAFRCLTRRGFNPEAPEVQVARVLYDDAVNWLRRVSIGQINPVLTDSAVIGEPGRPGRPKVVTSHVDPATGFTVVGAGKLRGW